MRKLLVPIIAASLWSTASLGAVQGDVTMKINHSHGLVSLGEYQVTTGDRVAFFKKTCVGPKLPVCKMEKVGGGHVVRVLNENYSEIETDAGVTFKEGYIVNKE